MTGVGSTATQRLAGIESLRAYAALSIVLFHLVWIGQAQPPEALTAIKWHGAYGVQLFFVVSAFSLSYGYWGRLGTERELQGYFVRRFARIAPLYYAIFALQLVHLALTTGIRFSPADVLLCLTFTFNFVPHLVSGIVPASWTIGVEMVFYLVFPFFLLLCRRWWAALLLLALTLLVAWRFAADFAGVRGMEMFAAYSVVAQLPFFCCGILAFHAYGALAARPFAQAHRRGLSWALVAVAVAGIAFMASRWSGYQFFEGRGLRALWHSFWGLPFAVLCVGMAIHPTRFVSNALTRYLGKVSYSLYLVHPNVVLLLMRAGLFGWIYAAFEGNALPAFLASAVVTIAIVAALSAVFFRFVEAPGMEWGKRVAARA